jgi:pimeloyl-ACP methyl ester carboxylesterase
MKHSDLAFNGEFRIIDIIYIIIFLSGCFNLKAQEIDTFLLHHPVSKYDTLVYTRIIQYNNTEKLHYVEDYFDNGQLQMKGTYSSFDKSVKENYWCNYYSNTKQGIYQTWYRNGKQESKYNFVDGKKSGLCREYYSNGQISDHGYWVPGNKPGNTRGMRNGNFKGWSIEGDLLYDFDYENGIKINPTDTSYQYILYTPEDYNTDKKKQWPLIIYLHGGSHRGTDLNKLYGYGIPDQIYRGREFPFIIAAPQCPVLIRWSTDNWFENFYQELKTKYRIDTSRVYLTGVSLGGSGTWYLAARYPDTFAAIAPMCGFSSHMDYIDQNISNLLDIPIWAFHGKIDLTVPVEETRRIVNELKDKHPALKYTEAPDTGHWIHWEIYPEKQLYDWFLSHSKE